MLSVTGVRAIVHGNESIRELLLDVQMPRPV